MSKRSVVDQYVPVYKKRGYKILDLNFAEPEKSTICYDPIQYLTSTDDIAYLSSALIMSDGRKANSKADPYWDSTSENLLNSIICMTFATEEHTTTDDVLRNIDKLRIKSDGIHIEITLDDIFEVICKNDPYGFCDVNWMVFSTLDSTKTTSCILSSLQTMMASIFTTGLCKQIAKNSALILRVLARKRQLSSSLVQL